MQSAKVTEPLKPTVISFKHKDDTDLFGLGFQEEAPAAKDSSEEQEGKSWNSCQVDFLHGSGSPFNSESDKVSYVVWMKVTFQSLTCKMIMKCVCSPWCKKTEGGSCVKCCSVFDLLVCSLELSFIYFSVWLMACEVFLIHFHLAQLIINLLHLKHNYWHTKMTSVGEFN